MDVGEAGVLWVCVEEGRGSETLRVTLGERRESGSLRELGEEILGIWEEVNPKDRGGSVALVCVRNRDREGERSMPFTSQEPIFSLSISQFCPQTFTHTLLRSHLSNPSPSPLKAGYKPVASNSACSQPDTS